MSRLAAYTKITPNKIMKKSILKPINVFSGELENAPNINDISPNPMNEDMVVKSIISTANEL